MGTSTLGYYQRFDEAEIGEDDFVDTELAATALNNLDHLADVRSQILVNWNETGATVAAEDYCVAYDAAPEDLEYYEIWRSTSFDLSITENGASYLCLPRLLVTGNHASVGVGFRVVLAWVGMDERAVRSECYRASTNTADVSVTQTAYTWEQADAMIYLDAEQVRRATRTDAPSIDSVGGENRRGVWLRAFLAVFGASDDVTFAEPRLAGVHLHELYPPA